jgi:hypothetical protein
MPDTFAQPRKHSQASAAALNARRLGEIGGEGDAAADQHSKPRLVIREPSKGLGRVKTKR